MRDDTYEVYKERDEIMEKSSNYLNINNNQLNNSQKITSNLEFVKSHVNNIFVKTHNCIDFCNDNHLIKSQKDGNLLYSKVNNIMMSYYGAQTKLMKKINDELKFIESVAETYKELDDDLASKAGDL